MLRDEEEEWGLFCCGDADSLDSSGFGADTWSNGNSGTTIPSIFF